MLRQSDGSLVFRLGWSMRNGTSVDLQWKQQSQPTDGSIRGFEPLNEAALAAWGFVDSTPGLGPECSSFWGIGSSDQKDTCVLDGSGTDSCLFNCIGLLQTLTSDSCAGGRGVPGPFRTLMKSYSFSVLEVPSAGATTPVAGSTPTVTVSVDLAVDNPQTFVTTPGVNTSVRKTFAQLLFVSEDCIIVTLEVTSSRTLSQRAAPRELQLGSAVRVGVTVLVRAGAADYAAQSGTTTTPPTATSLASQLSVLSSSTLTASLNSNLQQAGTGTKVQVSSISAPKVQTLVLPTSPSSPTTLGPVGFVVKKNSAQQAQWAVSFVGIAAAVLLSEMLP